MRPTVSKQQKYYFSDKLKKQLDQIPQYPLTIVEAPSGFGKTTAIREYLRNKHPQAACEWYTCLGESVPAAWIEICELFTGINSKVTNDLKNLKTPAIDTLRHIKAALKNLTCPNETYLVVDNYQLIDFDLHRELISVFSIHENQNLHMIFITHQLDSRRQFSLHNGNIHTIGTSSFFFDREDISSLFHMKGFRLTEGDLDSIFKCTEGWISAIQLQMVHYRETGTFVGSAGIEPLVETAIWNRLTPTEKDFLLSVSVFDSFTALQATHMLDYEILPGKIETELKTSDFIRFLPDKRLFIIHNVLLDYLRNQFYSHQPKEYQNRLLHKGGLSCAATGQYCSAAKFFYQAGDFGAILSLPFTRQYLDVQKQDCKEELLMAIIRECPDEILCKHPSTMIVFAHQALLNGKYGIYEKLCGLLRALIDGKTERSQEEIRRINGEFILLKSLKNFNNLSKMRKGYEMAIELLGKSPDINENSTPWFSVFPTAFGMFWRESGTLDELLHSVDELKPLYRAFSRGQGAGLAHLIRAEAVLTRGEDNEAEILCHKALYEAHAHRQASICIYAKLCLARIFILRSDTENFFVELKNIQEYAATSSDLTIRRMVDMCLSIISLLLGVKDYVAPWLYDMESIRKFLYIPIIPFAEILHFRLLLIDKRYNELYALSQLALEALQNPPYANIKYRMPQMYCLIFLAVAKHNNGHWLEAQLYLKEALDIALPDGVCLPFADHDCIVDLLSGLNMHYFNRRDFSCIPPHVEASRNPTIPLVECARRHPPSPRGTTALLFYFLSANGKQTASA